MTEFHCTSMTDWGGSMLDVRIVVLHFLLPSLAIEWIGIDLCLAVVAEADLQYVITSINVIHTVLSVDTSLILNPRNTGMSSIVHVMYYTHEWLYRESRYSNRRRTRSRSKSPVIEEKEKIRKKMSSEKKKSYRKDYSGQCFMKRCENMNICNSIGYKEELKAHKREKKAEVEENSSDLEFSDETTEMMRVMGFANFNSTKGEKKTPQYLGNADSEVRIVKKRRYRQYMNRRGGFNRPLDPIN